MGAPAAVGGRCRPARYKYRRQRPGLAAGKPSLFYSRLHLLGFKRCWSWSELCSLILAKSALPAAQDLPGSKSAHSRRLLQPNIDEARGEESGVQAEAGTDAETTTDAEVATDAAEDALLTLPPSNNTGNKLYRRAREVHKRGAAAAPATTAELAHQGAAGGGPHAASVAASRSVIGCQSCDVLCRAAGKHHAEVGLVASLLVPCCLPVYHCPLHAKACTCNALLCLVVKP